MLKILLFSTLFMLTQAHFLELFKIGTDIAQDCWVINTSNKTEIAMGNCHDQAYYITLGLGTPPQLFNFQIDTFRDLIWFPLNNTYQNFSDSFQISNKKSVAYINKNIVEGSIGSDIVTIPETNISTRSQIVWAHQNLDFSLEILDGILGLGYSAKPNFLDNAAQSNQINSNIFALQIGSLGNPSILYYNELPDFIEENNIYNPVISNQFWEVYIPNVKVGSFDYSYIASKKMIIDTGTSIMHFNPSLYKKLYSRFFSDCTIDSNKQPICPCTQDRPSITFVLQNVQVTIEPESYTRHKQDYCILLFGVTAQQQNPMLMGTSLMKNYIIVFDKNNRQVGFNGQPIGIWRQLFIIFQFVMLCLAIMVLSVGIYEIKTVKYLKKSSKQNLNTKLLQLSVQYIQS